MQSTETLQQIKEYRKIEIAPDQRFKIKITSKDSKIFYREVFEGEGQETYDRLLRFAKQVAMLYREAKVVVSLFSKASNITEG